MTFRFEIYAAGPARPEDAWALVGDLSRLREWTDVERVEFSGPQARPEGGRRQTREPQFPGAGEAGTGVVTHERGRRLAWTVSTREQRLVELVTTVPAGELGIGVRVVPDPLGCRVILAGVFAPATRAARLRFAVLDGPALRRRFDRWATTAARSRRSS